MTDLDPSELHVELIANLERCLRQSEGATKRGLSILAGGGPCAFGAWISGRSKPTLDHLCRLSFELRMPLTMLFKGVPAEWRGPQHLPERFAPRKRPQDSAVGGPQLREILAICLTQAPPPSVAEVARRLNFRRTQTLWSREPELCRKIAARHRDSPAISHAAEHLYKRSERRRHDSPYAKDNFRIEARQVSLLASPDRHFHRVESRSPEWNVGFESYHCQPGFLARPDGG